MFYNSFYTQRPRWSCNYRERNTVFLGETFLTFFFLFFLEGRHYVWWVGYFDKWWFLAASPWDIPLLPFSLKGLFLSLCFHIHTYSVSRAREGWKQGNLLRGTHEDFGFCLGDCALERGMDPATQLVVGSWFTTWVLRGRTDTQKCYGHTEGAA